MSDNAPVVLREKLKRVPTDPGVYLWKNADNEILYVGKAKVLRSRVRQYMQDPEDLKTRLLMRHVADLDWIVTTSEKESLILEATLIKRHLPRYNVRLRDDKRFISLKLDLEHDFPRLYVVRKVERDGNLYYGPFSDARAIRETLRFINASFLLRKCGDRNFASRERPCLQHQIGRCHAPCVGYIDRKDYAAIVQEVKLFFTGRADELLTSLHAEMEERAASLDYEGAAKIRDRLRAIAKSLEKQRVVSHRQDDLDAFGIYREGASVLVCQLFVRGGAIIGKRLYPFKNIEDENGRVLRQLLGVYYAADTFLPAKILVPESLDENPDTLAAWLADLAGHKIELRVAQRGEGRKLVRLAATNAKRHFEARRASLVTAEDVLDDLRRKLHLTQTPRTMECFDVSNVQGQQAVASQVRFLDAAPDKSGYRRYRIQTKSEPDDYAMLREALTRRVRRGLENDDLPDLLLIDGGKGQLGVALAVLEAMGVTDQPTAAITKIKNLAAGDPTPRDKVYLPGRKNAVTFAAGSHALHLLQRIRDEAHRFAITYHRKLRGKQMVRGELDAVPGLGPAKRQALLKTLGSVKRVREAGLDELTAVPGIGPVLAQTIYDHFRA